jgi:nucleoside-diphosphate-sugar epimerase
MRVLLTGHHGYVGSIAGPVLVSAGHDVVGLDAFFYDGCDLLPDAVSIPAHRLDLRDLAPELLDGFDAVVHLAALSNDPLGDLDPALTNEINYAATVRLAEAAKARGVTRFVFASSCSMYGAADSSTLVDETAPLAPLTAYASSKVDAERSLLALADGDFSPTCLRFATAYGASPRLRLDIVLNNLAGWALTTGKVRLLSDGSAWRPLIHVEDMAAAIAAVLDAPAEAVRAESFNVGATDANYRVRELAQVVSQAVPGSTVELAEGGGTDPRSYRVDFGKFAAACPGFRPTWTPERGAVELVNAYRRGDLTWDVFDGDRYVRLRRLRTLQDAGVLDGSLRRQDGDA